MEGSRTMRTIKGLKIKEPEDWDFEVPADSSQCIRDFLDAWERDDRMTDCYMDELHGTLRELPVEKDDLLHRYYLNGGWIEEQ